MSNYAEIFARLEATRRQSDSHFGVDLSKRRDVHVDELWIGAHLDPLALHVVSLKHGSSVKDVTTR